MSSSKILVIKLCSTLKTEALSLKPILPPLEDAVPLQTGLVILGELSKGLIFSLFAVGDVCLVSWTRHSFAAQNRNIVCLLLR